MKKSRVIQILCIVILVIILGVAINLTINEIKISTSEVKRGQMKDVDKNPNKTEEKETTAEKVDSGEIVTEKEIDLGNYSSNITITEPGNYSLMGEFDKSILINAEGEVILNLNNIMIKNDITATIANISTNKLTINLLENTTNTLSDGGSSEYDSCIYSMGPLTITGNGTLNVYGNQEEGEGIATETNDITINGGNINIESKDDGINAGGDGGIITINNGNIYIKASGDGIDSNKNLIINGGEIYTIGSPIGGDSGIDTDDGFVINGGTVIALGSDMLETPETNSKQKSACFNLNNKMTKGTAIVVKNENNEEIISFEANEEFKTLIISNSKIENGTYYLYQDGNKTNYTATVK